MDVGAGSNEDDLTCKLVEIIDVNSALRVALQKGARARGGPRARARARTFSGTKLRGGDSSRPLRARSHKARA